MFDHAASWLGANNKASRRDEIRSSNGSTATIFIAVWCALENSQLRIFSCQQVSHSLEQS